MNTIALIGKSILLSALLIASFIPVYAQMQPTQSQVTVPALPIFVTTDKQSYADGDRITISGSVEYLIADLPVTIEIRDPSGNIVMISQVHPQSDKTFSVTVTAGGFLWKPAGVYGIVAQYGSPSRSDNTLFQFSGFVPPATVSVGGTNMSISYEINNGQITNVVADVHTKALLISIKSTANGNVTVDLPRALIDAKLAGADASFVVTDHGTPVQFQETKTNTTRILTIPFSGPADDRLMITGTQIIPEFGSIAPSILFIAIVAIVLISAKNKLGLLKRN